MAVVKVVSRTGTCAAKIANEASGEDVGSPAKAGWRTWAVWPPEQSAEI